MNRRIALLISLALVACSGGTEEDPIDETPDAGTQADAGTGGEFSFHMNACTGHPGDLIGTEIQVAGGQDVLVVTKSPEEPAPWCHRLTPAQYEATDSREGVTGSATFELKIDGNKVTISGTTQASGTGPVATAKSGFSILDVRGGGGGVERVRVTIKCSGAASGSVAGASIELANGEPVCSTTSLGGGWDQTVVTFEEATSGPDDVLVKLNLDISALGGDQDGYSSSAQAKFEITVEPL